MSKVISLCFPKRIRIVNPTDKQKAQAKRNYYWYCLIKTFSQEIMSAHKPKPQCWVSRS